MPIVSEDTASTNHATHIPSSPPMKRQRVERDDSVGTNNSKTSRPARRVVDADISVIEGPATRFLREKSELEMNALKRKERTDPNDLTGSIEPEAPSRKKAREHSVTDDDESSFEDTRPGRKQIEKDSKVVGGKKKKKKEADLEDLSQKYLVVKTRGKKMTEHELEANREFNKLRISKPVLLQTQPVEGRRIGWNEKDFREDEIRQMDEWSKDDVVAAALKCSFKVQYVNLVNKTKAAHGESEDVARDDTGPNFKRFRPASHLLDMVLCITPVANHEPQYLLCLDVNLTFKEKRSTSWANPAQETPDSTRDCPFQTRRC